MSEPKVSVIVVHIDNSVDNDFANLVRIFDYDQGKFLFIHAFWDKHGVETKTYKEFKNRTLADDMYDQKRRFLIDDGNWNIHQTFNFNLTAEMLTDEEAFKQRFGNLLGKVETRLLFQNTLGRKLEASEGKYQIQTAHEGIW